MEVSATLLSPILAYRQIESPLDGFIQDVYFSVGANVASDAVFDIRKNGTSLWPGTPLLRPKILSGAATGSKLAINAAVAKGDLIKFDVATMPSGGLTPPFFTRLVLYDTIALRSTVIYTTGSLADEAIENADIPGMGRSWEMLHIESDKAAWVRAYISDAARSLDATRDITEDADENAGLGAEIIFSPSELEFGFGAPFPKSYNLDDPNSTDGLFAIQNRSGSTGTVTLTIQRLVTER